MPAKEQLTVLTLAALVACAFARPDLSNGATKTNYAFGTKGGVSTHKVDTGTNENQPQDTSAASKAANTALGLVAEADIVDTSSDTANIIPLSESVSQPIPLFRDESKPVHQRFPHAVLFGGTCGGSIISPKWVLTAGHCTLFTGGRYVLAGTNNSDDSSGVTRRVKKLYVHPLFTVGPYWLDAPKYDIKQVAARWDFMLVELEQPLDLNGVTISAVPLNDEKDITPETLVGYAGYGTDHHGGFMRSEMHAMDLKTKPDQICKKLMQYNSDDMLCARGYEPNHNSACNGDSGSGLVGNGKLMGVASWVENDAFECKPGNIVVFSKVAAVRDWIRQVANV